MPFESFSSHIYVPGRGNPSARIAIVGEAPSYEEVKQLTPFVGPSGAFLNTLLNEAGIDRSQCWLTNACKFMVPPNSEEKKIPFKTRAEMVGIDLKVQYRELHQELSSISPNIVIGLGGTALYALTGKSPIQDWRGSILSTHTSGIKNVNTYHPAHILHQKGESTDYWNKPVMIFDLRRAADESHTKEIKLPYRNIQICRSVEQFRDFIQRYSSYSNPAIDIEAFKCIPICVGISFQPHEAIVIPLWNIFGISDLPDWTLDKLWILLADFLSKHHVIGQNFGYDRDKIKRLGFKVAGLHSDTMLKAFTINPEIPKNLAFLTTFHTREPFYKNEGMYEGKIDDLLIGCGRDACVTKEIDLSQDNELRDANNYDYYQQFILPLHELYHFNETNTAIEQVGFRVDEEFRRKLIYKYIKWREEIQHELFMLTGEHLNVASPKQVDTLIYEKLKIPRRKGTGEEVITQLLANNVKDPNKIRILELILEGRRVRKTISSYLYSLPDFDGRMRTSYYLCLDTGRSATQQQDPPIRPDIEFKEKGKPKKKQSRGMAFQTITKHGDVGSDIRKILIPDEGCVFLQADLNQAEARVIFHLANEDVSLFDKHDIHALTASWFFGGTEFDHSKKVLGYETPIRFAGKTLRHAGHLGASKRRASLEINTLARKNKITFRISEAEAERALKIFHMKQPNIRGVFHEGIRECIERDRKLISPVPYGINAKVGGTRNFFEREGDELFRQAYSYLPQRTISEATKGAALRIRKLAPEILILSEAHDALLVMVKENEKLEAAKLLKEEMERPIDFSTCSLKRGILAIPSDIEVGYNYKELEKFKWL